MLRSRMDPVWIAAASTSVATAAAIVPYHYVLKMRPWLPALKVAVAGLVFAISFAAATAISVAVIRPCLSHLTKREAVICISLGLLCGWILVMALPFVPPPGLMPEHRLHVIAAGGFAAIGMPFPFVATCLWLVSRRASGTAGVPPGAWASWTWLGYGLPCTRI
ncbi:MAG: hypothetical protein ACLP9L_07510 [Thermoguttaceae bacterium]